MEYLDQHRLTRRGMLQVGSTALAAAATMNVADAQDESRSVKGLGPKNAALDAQNPDSERPQETDK